MTDFAICKDSRQAKSWLIANRNCKLACDSWQMAKDAPPKWIPTKLRAWREWKGMKLAELATDMPYNEGTLSLIENGKARYNQDVLEMAARVLEIPPSYLLARIPPPKGVDIDRTDPEFIAWELANMPDKKLRRLRKILDAYEDEDDTASNVQAPM